MELARTTGSQGSQKIMFATEPLQETTAEKALIGRNCYAVAFKQMLFADSKIRVKDSVKKMLPDVIARDLRIMLEQSDAMRG